MSAATAHQAVHEDAARAEMTDAVTSLLTAQVIVKSSFPLKETLPPIIPPAFGNHGHLLQLDYRRMLELVWQTVFEVQQAAKAWHRKRLIGLWASFGTCVCLWALLVFLISRNNSGEGGPIVIITIVSFVAYLVVRTNLVADAVSLAGSIADIRASAIRSLLDGTSSSARIDESIKTAVSKNCETGDGCLSSDRLPVLIVVEGAQPFPGYGRLQADTTLVCPRKDAPTNLDLKTIDDRVRHEIKQSVKDADIAHVSCGEVLAVDGWTIPADHPFLEKRGNGETAPPLWCSTETADILDSQPHGLSARKYFAIQILFPNFETTATLFTRAFYAGNSVAYQLAAATLGPPIEDGGHLRKQLAKHELEKSQKSTFNLAQDDRISRLRQHIRAREIFKNPFVDYQKIVDLKLTEFETSTEFVEAARSVTTETARWPGIIGPQRNWREENSYAFTTRYFGRPEVVASFRSIYVQISKAILRSLDASGFDTAAYQDTKGHYFINVDKIDQLLISENTTIESKKNPNQQTESQPKTGLNPQNDERKS